ncbi:hypothetical protein BSKO_03747 [Bryopsis sp. KO-2023]|nr:hypothetical protein BSKO_03747 [Bryopsis sp. KO-2023]
MLFDPLSLHAKQSCVQRVSFTLFCWSHWLSERQINNASLTGSQNIQSLVDCIPEGGRLRVARDVVLKPQDSIILMKPISVEGSADAGDSESIFDCALLNNHEPLFKVRGQSIGISNFTFKDCTGQMPAIIDVENSRNVTLSSLSFRSNGAVGINVNMAGLLQIHDVRFENNTGRALMISDSEVEVSRAHFLGNLNGAIEIGGLNVTKVSITNSTFKENTYTEVTGGGQYGAAIHLRESEVLNLDVSDCTFERNSVRFLGGAVFIGWLKPKAEAWFRNCTFFNNSAGNGGAVYIQGYWGQSKRSDSETHPLYKQMGNLHLEESRRVAKISNYEKNAKVHMVGCTFVENVANQSGGAIWSSQELHVKGSKFSNNRCLDSYGWGGGMMIQAPVLVEASTFHANAAERGGGMIVKIDDGEVPQSGFSRKTLVVVSRTNFTGNAALDGGAIFLDRTIAHFPFWGQDLDITGNKALRGGGICTLGHHPLGSIQCPVLVVGLSSQGVVLAAPSLEIVKSKFQDNTGWDSGGAIHAHKDFVAFGHTRFSGNLSKGQGGAIRLDGSLSSLETVVFQGNSAGDGGGVCMDDSIMVAKRSEFSRNRAFTGNGGAISAKISKVRTRKNPRPPLGAVECTVCNFTANTAAGSGGAIFFDQLVHKIETAACSPATPKVYSITKIGIFHNLESIRSARMCEKGQLLRNRLKLFRVVLKNPNFIGNSAKLAGGGVFVSTVDALELLCDWKKRNRPVEACPGWHSNSIEGGNGYGPVFASPLASAELSQENISGHKSGDPLPAFNVTLMDGWGQMMRGSDSLRVDLKSADDLLSGQRSDVPKEGVAVFTGTVAKGRPGPYSLKVRLPPSAAVEDLELKVEIRKCRIGELDTGGGMECQLCSGKQYSFNPSDSHCQVCPPNAICEGSGATVIPKPGFWHSTSRSTRLHQCLSPTACEFPNREDALTEKAKLAHWGNHTLTHQDDYQLCRKGFDGVLCGSCAPGHGRVHGMECEECREGRKMTYFWIVLGTFISLFVVGIFLRDMLSAEGEQSTSHSQSENELVPLTGRSVVRIDSRSASRDGGSVSDEIVLEIDADLPKERHRSAISRKAGENVTEATKILVNFLQLTALGLTIDLGWTKSVSTLLLLAGWIGTTFEPLDVEFVNLDCLFEDGKILPRMVLTFFFPFFALFIFIAFWAVARFRALAADLAHWEGFGRRCWLTTLAVLFISYTAITKNVYKVIYCVSVEDEEAHGIAASKRAKPYTDDSLNNCESWSLTASLTMFLLGLVLMNKNTTNALSITVSCTVFVVFFGFVLVTFWYMARWEGGLRNMATRLLIDHPVLGTLAKLWRFCSEIRSRAVEKWSLFAFVNPF